MQPDNQQISSGPTGIAGRIGLVLAWALLLAVAAELVVRGPLRAIDGSSDTGIAGSPDFGLYYCSARAMLQGTDPYELSSLQQVADETGAPAGLLRTAIAPPISYAPLVPLAAMDWPAAKAVWAAVNVLMAGLLVFFVAGRAGVRLDDRSAGAVLLAAMVLGLAALQVCIGLGQLAVVAGACLAGGVYFQHRGKPWHAGVCLGLAACLKPQMALIFLLYWLLRGRWRGFVAAGCVGLLAAAFCAVKLYAISPAWWEHWQQNLQAAVNGGTADYTAPWRQRNFLNLQYPVYMLFGSRAAAEATTLTFTLGVLAAAGWGWLRGDRSGRRELLLLSLLSVAGLLPIYHVWYDAVLLAVPLAWAISEPASPLRPLARATIILILPFLVPGPALMGWLEDAKIIPLYISQSWAYQALLLPYQVYLLVAMSAVLLAALFRRAIASKRVG